MTSIHSVTVQWKRSLENIYQTEVLPIYLSWSTETQLTASNVEPENGLFDYCIEVDQQRQITVIRPQDAHFDLFLQKSNGQIVQVIRALPIDDGDGLGIDEVRGTEWLVRIKQQITMSTPEQKVVPSEQGDQLTTPTAPPQKSTPPSSGSLNTEIWIICMLSLLVLSAVLWFGLHQ